VRSTQRTKAGLEAARSRGRRGGRPEKLTDKKKQVVLSMSENPNNSVDDICSTVGISRATYYRYLGKKTG
jgi:DNA invertase Pin-like site-specific DNA recombinase